MRDTWRYFASLGLEAGFLQRRRVRQPPPPPPPLPPLARSALFFSLDARVYSELPASMLRLAASADSEAAPKASPMTMRIDQCHPALAQLLDCAMVGSLSRSPVDANLSLPFVVCISAQAVPAAGFVASVACTTRRPFKHPLDAQLRWGCAWGSGFGVVGACCRWMQVVHIREMVFGLCALSETRARIAFFRSAALRLSSVLDVLWVDRQSRR